MTDTTPNTPANGGQILTDERINEVFLRHLGHAAFPKELAAVRAIEADLRASLAAPVIPTVDRNSILEEAAALFDQPAARYSAASLEPGIDPETRNVRHLLRHELLDMQKAIRALKSAAPASVPQHPDDIAIDAFAAEMKKRMAEKRAAGRKGWDNPKKCSLSHLMDLLRKTPVSKPVDIGNYAMMLFNRAVMENQGYSPLVAQPSDFDEWLQNPYTKVLQKSIAEDYIPKHSDPVAQPAAPEWKGYPYCWFHESSVTAHRTSFAPSSDCFALYTEQQVRERIGAASVAQPAAQVADIQASRTLGRFILENAGKFEWSLQGLGMLRLYLTKDIRLHVWDSRFAFADVSPIHDHLQWGLESTIIAGRLTNYRFAESSDGDAYLYSTLKPGYGCYFKHDPLPIKLQRGQAEEYSAGMSYSQRPNEIHLSAPEDGTVTLMRKKPTADADSARVFWPVGKVWGSAEPRQATPEEVAAITQYALSVWEGAATPATVKTAEGL